MTYIKLNNPVSIFHTISVGFLVSVFSMFYSFYLEIISLGSFPVDLCDIYMDGFFAIYNCPFWHPQSVLWRPMVSILSVIIISLNFIYFIFWSYQSSKYIIDV